MPDKHGNITVSDVEEVMNGISGQRQAMTFDMQKARQYAETSPLMSHAPYIVALDEIERQAKRIAELEAALVEKQTALCDWVAEAGYTYSGDMMRETVHSEKEIARAREQLRQEGVIR